MLHPAAPPEQPLHEFQVQLLQSYLALYVCAAINIPSGRLVAPLAVDYPALGGTYRIRVTVTHADEASDVGRNPSDVRRNPSDVSLASVQASDVASDGLSATGMQENFSRFFSPKMKVLSDVVGREPGIQSESLYEEVRPLGICRSTAAVLLKELIDGGWVVKQDGGHFLREQTAPRRTSRRTASDKQAS